MPLADFKKMERKKDTILQYGFKSIIKDNVCQMQLHFTSYKMQLPLTELEKMEGLNDTI